MTYYSEVSGTYFEIDPIPLPIPSIGSKNEPLKNNYGSNLRQILRKCLRIDPQAWF